MKLIKNTIAKVVQTLYRNVATSAELGFDLGDTPDPLFGYMSGTPLDRYLISQEFERVIAKDIFSDRKLGLEIGGTEYLRSHFGNSIAVQLDYQENTHLQLVDKYKLVGDLSISQANVTDYFDLIISTQLLSFVKDEVQAIENFRKLLKTGGVVIGTEPLVSPISIYDDSRWGENHRYSPKSLKALLETQFEILHFKSLGNAATSAAVVLGVPVERFNKQLLNIERPSHATCMFYVARTIASYV
jgi:SAM-dependent methyltransferase